MHPSGHEPNLLQRLPIFLSSNSSNTCLFFLLRLPIFLILCNLLQRLPIFLSSKLLPYFSCLGCLFFSFYASRINVLWIQRRSSMAATRAFPGRISCNRFLVRSEGLGHFNQSKVEATALPLPLLLPAVSLSGSALLQLEDGVDILDTWITWTRPQTFRCTHSDQQNYVIFSAPPLFFRHNACCLRGPFFCWQIMRMPTSQWP